MNGFDSYMPEKWIDQVFSVPLPKVRLLYKKRRLHTRSIKYVAGALILFFSASSGISMPNNTIVLASKIVDARAYPVAAPSSAGNLSPIGYIDKLFAAISSAESLPDESFEFDPPIFV